MKRISVTTQTEMDAVPLDFDGTIDVKGNVLINVRGRSAPHIVARDNSAPRIVAWDNSAPSIVAWENSAPRIEARGNSAPSIEAWGNSAPSIVAWGNSAPHIVAWGNSAPHIVAWGNSAPSGCASPGAIIAGHYETRLPEIAGEHVILLKMPTIATAEEWCVHYGVAVQDGRALLFKAVRDDYRSANRYLYAPGTSPEAKDWDGGEAECGGGLHFSPTPCHAQEFDPDATRFMACPVDLADMRPPKPDDSYPAKIKARRCGPVYEVDREGKALQS